MIYQPLEEQTFSYGFFRKKKSFMRHDLLILFFILLSSALMADEHSNEAPSFKVQGIVTDEKGEGLPGASVWVKGTVGGAGTNAKG